MPVGVTHSQQGGNSHWGNNGSGTRWRSQRSAAAASGGGACLHAGQGRRIRIALFRVAGAQLLGAGVGGGVRVHIKGGDVGACSRRRRRQLAGAVGRGLGLHRCPHAQGCCDMREQGRPCL